MRLTPAHTVLSDNGTKVTKEFAVRGVLVLGLYLARTTFVML